MLTYVYTISNSQLQQYKSFRSQFGDIVNIKEFVQLSQLRQVFSFF